MDLNGDKLRISRGGYLRISVHCRVTVRVRVRNEITLGLGLVLGFELGLE